MKDASAPSSTPTQNQTEPKADDTDPDPESTARAPETYADFKVPDGQSIDKALLDRATPIFRELDLDQAQAQKLIDVVAGHSQSAADLAVKAVEDMRKGWQGEVTKEFGGKLDTLKADVGRMYDTIFAGDTKGREAFIDAMNLTGAGDHPAIVRTMWKLSEGFREGQHVSGSGPSKHGQAQPDSPSRPSAAQAMYPNLPSAAA